MTSSNAHYYVMDNNDFHEMSSKVQIYVMDNKDNVLVPLYKSDPVIRLDNLINTDKYRQEIFDDIHQNCKIFLKSIPIKGRIKIGTKLKRLSKQYKQQPSISVNHVKKVIDEVEGPDVSLSTTTHYTMGILDYIWDIFEITKSSTLLIANVNTFSAYTFYISHDINPYLLVANRTFSKPLVFPLGIVKSGLSRLTKAGRGNMVYIDFMSPLGP